MILVFCIFVLRLELLQLVYIQTPILISGHLTIKQIFYIALIFLWKNVLHAKYTVETVFIIMILVRRLLSMVIVSAPNKYVS